MGKQINRVRYAIGRAKSKTHMTIAACCTYITMPKGITAMMRVRNEEEFLRKSVMSIIGSVARVVIVDNQSTDGTPSIIQTLTKDYPEKISWYTYGHEIYRVGKENCDAALANPEDPRLLANYYNYCLRKCRTRFVLKWDGDMIATTSFNRSLAKFNQSRCMLMMFCGANIHANRKTLIASNRSKSGAWDVLDNWVDELTDLEPRLFPRFMAKYYTGFSWCERLSTPFMGSPKYTLSIAEPLYAHMKYCKRDPYENLSPEFSAKLRLLICEGKYLNSELADCLSHWGNSPIPQGES